MGDGLLYDLSERRAELSDSGPPFVPRTKRLRRRALNGTDGPLSLHATGPYRRAQQYTRLQHALKQGKPVARRGRKARDLRTEGRDGDRPVARSELPVQEEHRGVARIYGILG